MSKLKRCLERSLFSSETKSRLLKLHEENISNGLTESESTVKVVNDYHNELTERLDNLKKQVSDKFKVKLPKESVKKQSPVKKITTLESNGKEKNSPNRNESSARNDNSTSGKVQESVSKKTISLRAGTKKANRKIKHSGQKMALRVETSEPYDLALQYFIAGGEVGSKALKKFFNNDRQEIAKRINYTRKDGKSLDEIAHKLWEDNSNLGIDDTVFKNAVESAINDFEHPSQMAEDINRRYNKVNPEDYSPAEIETDKFLDGIDNKRVLFDVENAIDKAEELSPKEVEILSKASDNVIDDFTSDIIVDDGSEPVFEPQAEYGKVLESKNGISNFTVNENTQKYKTKEGEEIPYNSLASEPSNPEIPGLFGEESKPNISDNGVEEICWMERQMNEVPSLNLTGEAKIKSNADIAYLFRHLEDAVSENTFAVFTKPDGSYNVLYISTGNTNATLVDIKLIYVAAKEFGASKITFVHNHPSGNLTPSDQDHNTHKSLVSLMKSADIEVADSVIINLDSGKYAEFNSTEKSQKDRPNKANDEVNVKVSQFNKQILYTPSSEKTIIKTADDIARFLSIQKRGAVPKIGVIVLDRRNAVNRYVMIDSYLDAKGIADSVMTNAGKSGEAVILVSNTKFNSQDVSNVKKLVKLAGVELLDAIEIKPSEEILKNYKSLASEGVLEPKEKYDTGTLNKFKKSVEMLYKIKDADGSSKKRTLAEQRREFLDANPSIKNIETNIKSIFSQLEEKGDLTLQGDCF